MSSEENKQQVSAEDIIRKLIRYCDHFDFCRKISDDKCTCGYSQLKKEVRELLEKVKK